MKQKLYLYVLYYLRFLAKLQLKKITPDIIGITASTGKTNCRNAVYAILKDKYKTKVSFKANSETGIPLNILGFPPRNYSLLDWLWIIPLAPVKLFFNWHSYFKYIVEMGIDSPNEPKNMSYLLTILRPRTAIFLNALPVHSKSFDHLIKSSDPPTRLQESARLIAHEKGKLITSLPENGLAILNADDENVIAFKYKTKAQIMTFGKSKSNHVSIGPVKQSLKGTSFQFSISDQKITLTLKKLVLDQHYAYTFAAALCVGLDEGYSLKQSVDLIQKNFVMPKGRMSIIPAIKGATILDSSYNSSRAPLLSALNTLDQIAHQRKLALLGDMRELGQEAKIEHETVASKIAQVCDVIYLIGPLMRQFALPIIRKSSKPISWFENAHYAAEKLKKDLRKGDTLLVKGSQNTIFLEYAIAKLMKNPQNAKKLLCRQNKFWIKKRAASGLG